MASGSALWAVQAAVYGVLTADSTLQTALGGTVSSPRTFDFVTENQAFPYQVFGRIAEVEDDTFDKVGRRVSMQIYVYSQYRGNSQLISAMDQTAALLDGTSLTIAGWSHIGSVLTRAEAGQIDGVTRAGAMEFLIFVSKT